MEHCTQIGWYNLKEDKTFYNTFECAAWYEEILVKAGKYPVYVYDARIERSANKEHDNELHGHIDMAYTEMDGTIMSDDFGTRFYGMPISDYDHKKNAGNKGRHSMKCYLHSIAYDLIMNANKEFELFPEYEARPIHFNWEGQQHVTYGIFKK